MNLSFSLEFAKTLTKPFASAILITFFFDLLKQYLHFMQKSNQAACILHKLGSHPYNLPYLREYVKHRKKNNCFFIIPLVLTETRTMSINLTCG